MRRLILGLLASLPLVVAAGGTVLQPHNVLVSRLRTEPVVAIDPVDPSLVVAGSNTDYVAQPDGTFPVPYFTSHDGGGSFSAGTLSMPSPYTAAADTSVAIAPDGTVFYSYLAESSTYCSQGPGAVLLAHSTDRGISFRGPVVVDRNAADDRPTMTVESMAGAAAPSHRFVSWSRSYPDHSEIWYARSVDGGATFGSAAMLYSSGLTNFGAEPVVGPNGHFYVFWLSYANVTPTTVGSAQLLLVSSGDDGAHFGAVHGAGPSFDNLPELGKPGSLRDLTTLSAAAAPSGYVYLAYAAVSARNPDGSVSSDIMLRVSGDHGATWTDPAPVNDVRLGDRFMPTVSVLSGGGVGVAFYDRRSDPGQLEVYAARASFWHGFKVSQNVRVTSKPSPIADIWFLHNGNSCFPAGRFFGDYIGSAPVGNDLAVVWTDTQLQQSSETDLWFARVALSALPLHAIALAPQKTSSGKGSSVLSWLGDAAGRLPLRGMSGAQLILVSLLFLLPALAVGTALIASRGSAADWWYDA
jgi:hypothetical protein